MEYVSLLCLCIVVAGVVGRLVFPPPRSDPRMDPRDTPSACERFGIFAYWLICGRNREANLASPQSGEWATESPTGVWNTSGEDERESRYIAEFDPQNPHIDMARLQPRYLDGHQPPQQPTSTTVVPRTSGHPPTSEDGWTAITSLRQLEGALAREPASWPVARGFQEAEALDKATASTAWDLLRCSPKAAPPRRSRPRRCRIGV